MTGFSLGPKARGAGYRLAAFDTIGSTNTEAMQAALAGDPGGIWFCALQQTEGRGRRGRNWATPHGNMAASLLIVPDCDPTRAATLGFVAGVSLGQALRDVIPEAQIGLGLDGANGQGARIALKWPNDVLADGAKLAGILLEARAMPGGGQAIVIGFGVNIVSAPDGLPYPATSLRAMGAELDAGDVHSALAERWVDAFRLWDGGRGLPEILAQWRQSAAGIGASVAISNNGEVVRGIFETIDDEGRLVVKREDGAQMTITAGDVHFGATASLGRQEQGHDNG